MCTYLLLHYFGPTFSAQEFHLSKFFRAGVVVIASMYNNDEFRNLPVYHVSDVVQWKRTERLGGNKLRT